MRHCLFAFAVPFLTLAGCGGGAGCTTDIEYIPSGAYAGSYVATFTPTGAGGRPLTFAFAVSSEGTILGTVTDSTSDPDKQTAVTGTAVDVRNGCTTNTSGLRFNFTFAGSPEEFMELYRSRRNNILGTYEGEVFSNGSLVVSRASS